MNLKRGCKVPFPERLEEGYRVKDNRIIANIGMEKAEPVLTHFITMHQEPLFFLLELPSAFDKETETGPGVVEMFHKDVYYIDGCS